MPQGYRVEAAVAIGRWVGKDKVPEELRAREQPNGRLPVTQLAMEGRFRNEA